MMSINVKQSVPAAAAVASAAGVAPADAPRKLLKCFQLLPIRPVVNERYHMISYDITLTSCDAPFASVSLKNRGSPKPSQWSK
jgi:hypothetical protein